jgi:AAA15 family ATPase/GTPase
MISEIYLPEELRQQYNLSENCYVLSGINRINIFIGPNNSGKSRLLRGLYSKSFKYHLAEQDFLKWRSIAESIYEKVSE